jgi:hypothetical protein
MKSQFLKFSPIRGKAKAVLLSAFALSAFALSVFPSGASASLNEYTGNNLPGHVWTVGNGAFLPNERWIHGEAETTSSVCVCPMAGGVVHQEFHGNSPKSTLPRGYTTPIPERSIISVS